MVIYLTDVEFFGGIAFCRMKLEYIHEILVLMIQMTSGASDQPAHPYSLVL